MSKSDNSDLDVPIIENWGLERVKIEVDEEMYREDNREVTDGEFCGGEKSENTQSEVQNSRLCVKSERVVDEFSHKKIVKDNEVVGSDKLCDTSEYKHKKLRTVKKYEFETVFLREVDYSEDRVEEKPVIDTCHETKTKKPKRDSDLSAYQCPNCTKTFVRFYHLKEHERVHNGERPYPCDKCHLRFTQKSNLKKHQLVHTGQKPYRCEECDKRFSQVATLKQHQFVHSGLKPHKCDFCSKKFAKLSDIKRHQVTHTKEKNHQCCLCSKKFAQLSSMKHHMSHSHEIIGP